MWVISWLVEELSASQEGLCYMDKKKKKNTCNRHTQWQRTALQHVILFTVYFAMTCLWRSTGKCRKVPLIRWPLLRCADISNKKQTSLCTGLMRYFVGVRDLKNNSEKVCFVHPLYYRVVCGNFNVIVKFRRKCFWNAKLSRFSLLLAPSRHAWPIVWGGEG
jgi:hypothetical protein